MLTIGLTVAATAAAYRATLSIAKRGPAGSKRARIFVALGGSGGGPKEPL